MAEVKSWFRRGEEGFRNKDRIDAATALRKEKGVPRFSLKADSSGIGVFVDDVPFFVWEHNLEVDGRWGNYVTCVKEIKACEVCSTGKKSTYTGYLTFIDTREYVRADGTKVKNRKILYPAKGSTIKRLEDLKKKHGTLVGMVFQIKRYSKDDPNCGTDFEFIKQVSLTGDNAKPHDYEKIFLVPTAAELAGLGFTSTVVGQQNGLADLAGAPTPIAEIPHVEGSPSTGATATDNFEDLL